MIGGSIEELMNVAIRHMEQGRNADGAVLLRQVLAARGDHAAAHYLLGNCLLQLGQAREAIISYERALHFAPRFSEAQANLGVALMYERRFEEAAAALQRAIEMNAVNAEAHNNLGMALQFMGRLDEAKASYQSAVRCRPNYSEAHNNLGNILRLKGNLEDANVCYREALRFKPENADAHFNLGGLLYTKGDLDAAVAEFREAVRIGPGNHDACRALASALKDRGEMEEAIECLRRSADQGDAMSHSFLILLMEYHPHATSEAILEECRRWNRRFAEPLRPSIRPHLPPHDRDPARRLRIGYVSPCFHQHPVGRFMLPLLAAHDRSSVEVFCYADEYSADAMTRQLRDHADHWRAVEKLNDEQVAAAVRQDGIDILVDLSMHMWRHRLLVFARKPAPVQACYLAYCSTTGLGTMDYRITDPYLDPVGRDDGCYSERSVRVASYWCYAGSALAPAVNALPGSVACPPGEDGTRRITFGALNSFCKVSPQALDVWARLLLAVPESRLLLHAQPGAHRERVKQFLTARGVEAGRCEFAGSLSMADYFQAYHQIDVALDSFPYAGGTTTCDALWMGVPVVTSAGQRAVGRGGVSILTHVGLGELVARDEEEYVKIAADLARDIPRLRQLRGSLRERMRSSPLMDAPGFARNMEAAYREMWRRYCA